MRAPPFLMSPLNPDRRKAWVIFRRYFPLFSTAAFLAACKTGPDYHRPPPLGPTPMPSAYATAVDTNHPGWKTATPAAQVPRGTWWELFGDAELSRLENVASSNNFELAAALARFEQARAQVNISRAGLFPQVDVVPSYNRQRTSFNQPENGHAANQARTYNTFYLPLQAGWELDLWGRVRRQVESARAQTTASADDLEATRLAVQAELAIDYFTMRALDKEYDVVINTMQTYRHSLELTVNRRRGGIATDLDVSQAETQLRTTEAELPILNLQRTKLQHAMASLCGLPAAEFKWVPVPTRTNNDPLVPAGLPSELLERRPDVAAAEQRMAAANAQVGVAQAAFYPRVRLDGVAGFQSINAGTFFDWPSRLWSVGPTLDLPVFTGGRNRAQLAFSKAAYEETVAAYRQTVIGAFQEVENQLAAQQELRNQLTAEAAALEAAQRTLSIANNRYKAGLVTYLEVATAQSSALSLERTAAELHGQQLVATVGLIRAIGGGWQGQEPIEKASR
jgi:multidrug efflux system outer membrane protein